MAFSEGSDCPVTDNCPLLSLFWVTFSPSDTQAKIRFWDTDSEGPLIFRGPSLRWMLGPSVRLRGPSGGFRLQRTLFWHQRAPLCGIRGPSEASNGPITSQRAVFDLRGIFFTFLWCLRALWPLFASMRLYSDDFQGPSLISEGLNLIGLMVV